METMTDFELCKAYRQIMAKAAAEIWAYNKSWGNEFCVKSTLDAVTNTKASNQYRPIDPNNLTLNELRELGFGTWDDESNLMLIPLWLAPFLAGRFIGGSINDMTPGELISADLDRDNRFGCLAYGVFKEGCGDD